MEIVVLDIWLPYDPFLLLLIVILVVYLLGRTIWRLIPVVGG